jgi:hypothetical protein
MGVEKDVLRAGLTRVGVEGDKGEPPDRHSYSHELGGVSSRSPSSTSESGEDEAGGEAGGTCVPERSEYRDCLWAMVTVLARLGFGMEERKGKN